MRDDYQLLGLEPNAGPNEIRAAYIAMLKRLHPDASGSSKDAERISELVGAYRRLRDPTARKPLSPGTPVNLRAAHRPAVMRLVRASTPVVFWGKALTLGLLAGAIIAAAVVTIPPPVRRQIITRGPPQPASLMPEERAEPDEAVIRQAVGAFQSFGPQEGAAALESHSRRCFAELQLSRDLQLLDYCLAFDIAASQSNVVSSQAQLQKRAFFDPFELKARHAGALRLLFGDQETGGLRRSRIESETVSALASAISFNDLDQWPR
jgi:hypothetical protein